MERALGALTVAYLAVGLTVAFLADYAFGVTAFPWVLAFAVSMSVLVGALGWWLSRRRFVAVATLVVAAGLIALRFVALSPVKPFRVFYQGLEPGMSEAAVLTALEQAFPAERRYPEPKVVYSLVPKAKSVAFALDPENPRYDSELIVARLEGDSLTETEYLPD